MLQFFYNFIELAEALEFEVYIKYARDVTSSQSKEALQKLLATPEVSLTIHIGKIYNCLTFFSSFFSICNLVCKINYCLSWFS